MFLFTPKVVWLIVTPTEYSTPGFPIPSPSLEVCSSSCLLSHWCYLTISSSVTPFSSCTQSFPASGSFPVSRLFTWSGQSLGASASALVTNEGNDTKKAFSDQWQIEKYKFSLIDCMSEWSSSIHLLIYPSIHPPTPPSFLWLIKIFSVMTSYINDSIYWLQLSVRDCLRFWKKKEK